MYVPCVLYVYLSIHINVYLRFKKYSYKYQRKYIFCTWYDLFILLNSITDPGSPWHPRWGISREPLRGYYLEPEDIVFYKNKKMIINKHKKKNFWCFYNWKNGHFWFWNKIYYTVGENKLYNIIITNFCLNVVNLWIFIRSVSRLIFHRKKNRS